MKKDIKIFYLVLILILITNDSYSQKDEIRFSHLTIEDGLSQNTVHSILKDSKGHIWFGTQDGLNRYDGYNFTVYRPNSNDSCSISHHWITAMIADSSVIWIGTFGGGLNKYDLKSERFTHYKHDTSNRKSISDNRIWCLLKDKSNNLWIGTLDGGISRMSWDEKNKPVFKHYKNNPDDPNSLSHNRVRTIYEDKTGVIWIGTSGGGLNKLNPKTGKFTRYLNEPGNPNSLSNNHVWGIFEDKSGILWIGTYGGGLNKFDQEKEIFTHYRFNADDPASISSDLILSIYGDPYEPGKTLWIATWGGGLNKFDIKNEIFTNYKNSPTDSRSLNSNNIVSVYSDNTGLFWIGTIGNGINKFVNEYKFQNFKYDPNETGGLNNNNVTDIYEDEAGNLWIGTNGGGLNKFDVEKGRFVYLKHNPNDQNSLVNNIVNIICEDKFGSLWFGTNKGISCLSRKNRNKGIFKNYKHDPNNPNSLGNDDIGSLYSDKSGILWIGTGGGGLDKFNPKTEKFTHYRHDPNNPNGLSNNMVTNIYEDKSGYLWICTRGGGLNKFDRQKKIFTHYKHDPNNSNSISSDEILSLLEDENNILWIGTAGGGLCKFDRLSDKFVTYTKKEGLPNNIIYGILEDSNHNLWLSTNKGLSKFNPENNTFNNYDVTHGLQSNEFNQTAHFKNKSGKIFFGGVNGLNSFYPDSIKENQNVPPIVLTSFKKFDEEIEFDKPISDIREMKIPYSDNFFSFEFAALDFFAPEQNQYKYKLEGFDKHWINSGTRRYASYTNLDGGEYVFRVKAANNDGIWNEEGLSIKISVIPPFWKTTWFRIIGLIVILSLAFAFYKLRTHNIKKRNKVLEDINIKLKEQIQERLSAEQAGKQAEGALRQSEKKFRELANMLPQIVYEMNIKGNLTFVNRQAFDTFGYSQEDFDKGVNIIQTLIPEDIEKAKVNIQSILKGKNIGGSEYTALKKNGKPFPIIIYSSSIVKNNKPVGLRGIIIDITEQKKAEEELIKHREHLEELVKERTKELEEKNNKLEEFNKLFVGREFRIKELRDKIKELEEKNK